jgi:GTP-binding protein HflX
VIALVGYTNAGKSSLLNALTGAGVLVEDKLFSTLDPTTRRLELPSGREALLTDTVGFIRKLPHDLVAAFRATLEGIEEASLILHVVDGSHSLAGEQIAAVEEVLAGLETAQTPRLIVWNKSDLLPPGTPPVVVDPRHGRVVTTSARRGDGLEELLTATEGLLATGLVRVRVLVPYDRYELVAMAFEQGTVERKEDVQDGVKLRALVPAGLAARLEAFAEPADPEPELNASV